MHRNKFALIWGEGRVELDFCSICYILCMLKSNSCILQKSIKQLLTLYFTTA